MKLARGVRSLVRFQMRNQYLFCKKMQSNKTNDAKQEQNGNKFIKFLKDGWRQTFPKQQDEVRRKYEKAKQVKRYSEQQLKKMQENIPQYQRTAMVQTDVKVQEKQSRFKVSNLIPESVKKKVTQTSTYKQYSEFKQNLKEFVNTSDSAAVNLGTKAYKVVSQPSTAAKATETMRQYDKQFSLMQLEKEAKFIFRDAYQQYLQSNVEGLQMLCGDQALDLFKSLIKINQTKKVRPKYTQILHINETGTKLQKTLVSQNSLPSFLFSISFMQIYCMVDSQGKVVDGDDERIMSSTFQYVLKYSGEYISELGHPWQITEFRKVDQVKLLL